jgi:hypothetical protein
VVDHELEFAARLVQRDLGPQQHLLAVLRLESDAAIASLEHRRAALRFFVLQREVPVARSGAGKIRNFALDPQAADALGKHLLDLEIERRNRPDSLGCGLRGLHVIQTLEVFSGHSNRTSILHHPGREVAGNRAASN